MIIYTGDYNKKVNDFLKENNFQTVPKDPTEKYNKLITRAVQQSDAIINKNKRKFLIQKKPQPPDLRAQIKLHKPG